MVGQSRLRRAAVQIQGQPDTLSRVSRTLVTYRGLVSDGVMRRKPASFLTIAEECCEQKKGGNWNWLVLDWNWM